MPFRLLDLPLELQCMVFREIVAPVTVDEPLTGLKVSEFHSRPMKQVFLTSEAAAFLRTSKHINIQASQIFWNKRVCEIALAEDYKIIERTKTITDCLRSEYYHFDRFLGESLAVLCHELATRCRSLRNIIIDFLCLCRFQNSWVDPTTGVERKHSDCLEPQAFATIFKPIKRLRVTNNIALRCSCRAMDKIQPVFDDLTAICRSSEQVEPLSGGYKAWFDLKEKDRSKLMDPKRFQYEFSQAWLWLEHWLRSAQDRPFEELEARKGMFWTYIERADTVRKGGKVVHP
ncbi:MAG: hypothetical protein Q9213_000666 [Squamulea squamosa]